MIGVRQRKGVKSIVRKGIPGQSCGVMPMQGKCRVVWEAGQGGWKQDIYQC